jgi:hypothetical protein
MEKIFSFFKNNQILIIALIVVILMMCQSKKKKVTEGFSSSTSLCYDEDGSEIDCGIHSTINEELENNITKEEWKNNIIYSQNYCREDCNGILNMDNNIPTSCDTTKINNLDEYKKLVIGSDSYKNYKKCNIVKQIPKKELTLYHANEELLNSYIQNSLQNYKSTTNGSNNRNSDPLSAGKFTDDYTDNFKYMNKTIQNIINLKDKTSDAINAERNKDKLKSISDNFQEELEISFKKYDNFYPMVLEIVNNYKDAILDKKNGIEQIDASSIMRATYQSFKKDGTIYNILGNDNNIREFEREILEKTNVNLKEPAPINGVTFDENGNLREHRSSQDSCYLITALTKHQHLSLGQVNQLRKLMLKSFNNHSNRKFFSFYYENFEPIANMLVKENKLVEIMPNMLKCIELFKNGLFDEAFEQYILVARQAYVICKEMGMDTVELEEKWDRLDGTISQLPEPNSLFVENGFREALKSC